MYFVNKIQSCDNFVINKYLQYFTFVTLFLWASCFDLCLISTIISLT